MLDVYGGAGEQLHKGMSPGRTDLKKIKERNRGGVCFTRSSVRKIVIFIEVWGGTSSSSPALKGKTKKSRTLSGGESLKKELSI